MNINIFSDAEIISSTPKSHDHSVGFHDVKPFNILNPNLIAIHRYPLKSILLEYPSKIEICLWDFKKNIIHKIDDTYAWSWEQGARLQWISKNELIYNQFGDNKLKSCLYDINTKTKKFLKDPIYSLDIKNKKNLFINYLRLRNLWNTYGYNLDIKDNNHDPKPKDDGVFIADFNDNKKLVLSIYDAVELCNLQNIKKPFFLAHPRFSPNGKKFVSLLRFTNDSGALISFLICTNLSNLKSKVIARERVSHFEWINDDSLIVWSRNLNKSLQKLRFNKYLEQYIVLFAKKIIKKLKPNIQKQLLSTHFHLIDLNNDKNIKIIDKDVLIEDGHPQISNCRRFLINDTYPNSAGYQKLMIYDIKKDKTHLIGEFKISDYLNKNHLKYDLHPRWSNDDKLINFDSSHEIGRQSYVLNIEKILNKIK